MWFPSLSKTKVAEEPRLRLVTFPNAGSAENVYTGMDKTAFGGESGRRENLLMHWAKANKVEVWAAQPPGREQRMKEATLTSCAAQAQGAFEAAKEELFEGSAPWAVLAHSMGTWTAVEFIKLAPRPPTILVASGFASPTRAVESRPWTPLDKLEAEEDFKDECRRWNINDVVFTENMWRTYGPFLREEFKCFNDYPQNFPKFSFPVRAIYGTKDERCGEAVVREWSQVSDDFAVLNPVDGHHLFVYDEPARQTWFKRVIAAIEAAQPLFSYECAGKKGAAMRTGCELTTALVEPEIQPGWVVEVKGEKVNMKGTDRLHIVSYAESPGGAKKPVDAWASKKLFVFKGVVASASVVAAAPPNGHGAKPPASAPAVAPSSPETSLFTAGKRYVVTGKAGAMLRSGCDLDTEDLNLTLSTGTECFVVQEKTNASGSLRARIVLYSEKQSPYATVDGWCTAKFLTAVGDDKEEALPAAGSTPFLTVFPRPTAPKQDIVVLFPGQGAQKVGMLEPYVSTPGVKAMFEEASVVFGEDLLALVSDGPVEKLNDTRFSQVCVFLTSLAAMKKVEHEDPSVVARASACAGFSLGEYTALAFAGVLELKTALELLKVRGEAMGAACDASELPTGMMTVVGVEEPMLLELLADVPDVSIANQLFPKGRVLSGPKDQLQTLEAAVKALNLSGSKTIVQPVSGAFHSKYMKPAADALERALETAKFATPNRLVYSNVTAKPHAPDVAAIKQKMVEQLTAGVLWEDTIRDVDSRFPETAHFYEPQPGKQLSSMMRRINADNLPKMKNV
ncbi:hypothetical protein CTAYLR_009457 [Chrysophaeum taylorii]|uniref:Malonyl-CoA:ACP transacylase (MAT) domain-containing protein n=1 Tax=Chrysophaeum taylorii TaxID=2483200 RepID=A0AAD7XK03_9STRA|nr:hypothetical protein CTAYLR_009457 [Chrysophaeum taylorii]